MKTIFPILFILSFIRGCDYESHSPVGDVTYNSSGGYWRLESLYLNGKKVPLETFKAKSLLAIHPEVVPPDTNFRDTLYPKGTSYRVFEYFSFDKTLTSSEIGLPYDFDYRQKENKCIYWYRRSYYKGFNVILEFAKGSDVATKMSISNLMESTEYKSQLDSVRYIYVPTEKFK